MCVRVCACSGIELPVSKLERSRSPDTLETHIDSVIGVSIRIDNRRVFINKNVTNRETHQPTIDKEGLLINWY